MKSARIFRDLMCCGGLLALASCGEGMAPGGDNPAAVATKQFRYNGLCEASAAAVLDDVNFAVASDDSETLAIYRRGQAEPIATVEHKAVTDLEGAARIGDTIYWLTAHSLSKGGEDKPKPKRKVLFATKIVANAPAGGAAATPSLTASGANFVKLRERLAPKLGVPESELAKWLNIEGLAATPDGNLLAGVRSRNKNDARAYVVSIDQPASLVGTAPSTAGPAAAPTARSLPPLNLGGRGIRSMERVGEGTRPYLIVAGPRNDRDEISFALFWWDGASDRVTAGPAVDFGDMTPEALIAWPDGEIQILGDNELNCKDDDETDKRPRNFPSLSLKL
jgi:hypothetical protein